jgi:hypothetical protein
METKFDEVGENTLKARIKVTLLILTAWLMENNTYQALWV